jgi:nanoRNase/pAp phosphatase (c-di-AMP/oligoRNAs hydrolase)
VKGRYDRHSKTQTRDAMMAALYRYGFSIAEVARRMMRSPGCVEKVLHRLRVEMRRQGSPRNDIRDSLITLGYANNAPFPSSRATSTSTATRSTAH